MWKAFLTLIALGVITISIFAGHALHGWMADAKSSWLDYQEQRQEIALERDRIALEEEQLALDRKRAENQAAVAAAQTEYVFRQTVFYTFLVLMLVVVPILTMVLVWRYFQKRQSLIWPNRDGVFPMPTMYPAEVAALSGQTAMAFHQTRALAAQNAGTPVHYAPHTHTTYHHTAHGAPQMPAPDQVPAPGDAPQVDLAALKVDLLAHLRSGTTADSILLGVDAFGNEARGDIHTMMHTLSGGTTGGGKTTLLASLGLQLAFDPNVSLVVADPHLQELSLLEESGALMYPLPRNAEQATALLVELAREVRRRADLFAQASDRLKEMGDRRVVLNRLDKFNSVCAELGLTPIPAVVAFGDELWSLVDESKEGSQAIRIVTSEGRKYGVYFVGGSQSWKSNVVDSATRSMFQTRYLLPGLTLQQAAAILEMEQKQVRSFHDQLTAPGICALWRRGQPTVVVKAPYIDLESERVWDALDAAAQRRESRTMLRAPWEPQGTTAETGNGHADGEQIGRAALQKVMEAPEQPMEEVLDSAEIAALQTELRSRNGQSQTQILKEVFGVRGGRRNAVAKRLYQELMNEVDGEVIDDEC